MEAGWAVGMYDIIYITVEAMGSCLACKVQQKQMLEARFMICILDTGFAVALDLYSYLGYHNSTVANTVANTKANAQIPMLSLHHEKPIPQAAIIHINPSRKT